VNPLSAIYGSVTKIRNRLYDRGTLRCQRLSRPVISVGNISAGGSGKTPFVILLGDLLKQRGIRFDVLSRGYGRDTHGVLVVDPSGNPRQFGDEPILISQRLGCPVIVGENRYEAGMFAEKTFNSAFHLLDDAFQHRSLARDFDIVLFTSQDLNDDLLPTGRLREPLSCLGRADAVVLSEDIDAKYLPAGKFIWRVKRTLSIPPQVQLNSPFVFCGIARPQSFLDQLRAAGIQVAGHKFYRDHHRYSERDITKILALRDFHNADGFITTQKDMINLGPLYARLAPICFPPVNMELTEPADALDTMLRVIADRRSQP